MYVLTIPGPRHGEPFIESVPLVLRPELTALVDLFAGGLAAVGPTWNGGMRRCPAWAEADYEKAA